MTVTKGYRSRDQWLSFIESCHPQSIALGLDRVRAVSERLHQKQACPLFIVAGTNGKGSTCALLESVLRCAGYRTGMHSSPHLLHYNERVRINGVMVDDEALCEAFDRVDRARQGIALTYFEFGVLAAWEMLSAAEPDVLILEVGMGGRLDAVNIYEPDCALITPIDMDHMAYLGNTREAIGYEKAGIMRAHKPVVCTDAHPPESLCRHAQSVGADLLRIGQDFGADEMGQQWQYWRQDQQTGARKIRSGLPMPALRGAGQISNACGVIAALECMRDILPVSNQEIRRGLLDVVWPGRFQVLPGRPQVILDVAHNPQAARALASALAGLPPARRTWAIVGILRDKDIEGILAPLLGLVTDWLPCTLDGERGQEAEVLAEKLRGYGARVTRCDDASPAGAWMHAQQQAQQDDRIVVFGSFLTVAAALTALHRCV